MIAGILQNVRSYDPTRTLTLRNQFSNDADRRFNRIATSIYQKLVRDQFLSVRHLRVITQAEEPLLPVDPIRVSQFMGWIRRQIDKELLSSSGGRFFLPAAFQSPSETWMYPFIVRSYTRGIQRAEAELKRAGYRVQDTNFNSVQLPVHDAEITTIHQSSLTILQRITRELDSDILSILTAAAGITIREIYDKIKSRIEKSTKQVRRLVRTEASRAHHKAVVAMYDWYRVRGVYVLAEILTARDERVCMTCASLEGEVYTLEEVRDLIPVHPLCRCMILPVSRIPNRLF